jgi:Uma2 family endonuclease
MAHLADPHELHRYTLEEYHRMVESGGLDDDTRIELIDGWVLDMSPKTRAHEQAVRFLVRWISAGIDHERYELGVGSPLTIGDSEPEPDLAVIPRTAPRPYHPATAALVVEVAVSSQRRDLVFKPGVYARADVPEYWVCDLPGRRVVCHSDPVEGAYATRRVVAEGEAATVQDLALPPMVVADLLRAASA